MLNCVMSESDAEATPSPDPVRRGKLFVAELLRELESVDSELIRARHRVPSTYELSYGPAQFRSILAVAKKGIRDWEKLPPAVTDGIERGLMRLIDLVSSIEARPELDEEELSDYEGHNASAAIKQVLTELQDFFSDTVEPLTRSSTDDGSSESLSEQELEEIRRTREELDRSKVEIADLESRSARIESELESRSELVEAARAGTGSAGAQDLAVAYEDQAQDHGRQWKIWGAALGLALFAALVGGYLVLKRSSPPDDATTAQLLSHLAVDLLVIGLLIYGVRVTSLQFSVHRHLAAVASNKAAALKTFARILSSGSSAETRDRLAEVLAHHVFTSDTTGFLDASSDQVTLPERVIAPIAQRINGGG
jgi:hypothetical protein